MILKRLLAATSMFATFAAASLPAEGQEIAPPQLDFSGEGLGAAGDAAVDGDHNDRNVHISGSRSWRIDHTTNTVRLQFSRVSNDSSNRTTGTLYAILALSERDDLHQEGRTGRYHEVARVRLGELRPGGSFTNIDRRADFSRPPAGTYRGYLVIIEYDPDNSNWEKVWIAVSRSRSTARIEPLRPQISIDEWSWDQTGNNVRIQIRRVSNDSSSRATGTLYAMLAFSERDDLHQGGTGRYHEAARVRLGELQPGRSLTNIDRRADFSRPPNGTYWAYMVILEYDSDNSSWESLWIAAARSRSTIMFDRPRPQISISGEWNWDQTGNNVRIQIGRVSNDSSSPTTGTLYAMLALSERDDLHQEGRTGRYHEAARVRLGELRPGQSFTNIDRRADFSRPADGTYWSYMVILEYDSDNPGWERLWIAADRSRSTSTFDDPDPQISVSLSAPRSVSEGDEVRITATANRPVNGDVRITLEKYSGSASNNDYTVGDIVIRSGQRQGETTLSARMDNEEEGDETLTLEGRWSGGTTGRITLTIVEDEGTVNPEPVDSAADRAVLEALYDATGGANWNNNANWKTDRPLSEWHGVTTAADGRVAGLDLKSNNLTGQIPRELGGVTELATLNLNGNNLTGEIPRELRGLRNLTYLGVGSNNLTGEIPRELGSLTNLVTLSLQYNNLTGEIPRELGSLTNLGWLLLDRNNLASEIPRELGSLTNLRVLYLQHNNLTGEIPRELGSLTNLQSLYLNYNNLTGAIPEELRAFESNINPQQGGVNLPVGTPVPALPAAAALLLACGLWHIGRRRMAPTRL